MSLSMGEVGRMPRRYAATLPLFGKRHPYAESSFSSRWRRRCGWGACNGIDSSGFTWLESFIRRSIPVYPSWMVVRRLKGIFVRCSVRRLPSTYCADVHRRSWNWGWIRRLRWLGAVLLILLNNLHRCQYIKRIGRQIKVIQTWRHYRVLGTKSIWESRFIRVRFNGYYLWLRRSDGWNCYRLRVHSSRQLCWVEHYWSVVSNGASLWRWLLNIKDIWVRWWVEGRISVHRN